MGFDKGDGVNKHSLAIAMAAIATARVTQPLTDFLTTSTGYRTMWVFFKKGIRKGIDQSRSLFPRREVDGRCKML